MGFDCACGGGLEVWRCSEGLEEVSNCFSRYCCRYPCVGAIVLLPGVGGVHYDASACRVAASIAFKRSRFVDMLSSQYRARSYPCVGPLFSFWVSAVCCCDAFASTFGAVE